MTISASRTIGMARGPAIRFLWLVAAVLLNLATPVPASAQSATPPSSFTLDMAAPVAQEVALAVQAPATVSLKILRNGAAPAGKVALDVSTFVNEQGVSMPVSLAVGGSGGTGVTHLDDIAFDRPVLPVDLLVPALPAPGKYAGRLMITAPGTASGQDQVTLWRFVLTSAGDLRPATLVIDQSAVSLSAVRPWCLFIRRWNWCTSAGDRPVVTVHLRDKSGAWPIDGVMARFEPGLKADGPGFDPKAHITASFDGVGVTDIFTSPPHGERRIDPRGQGTVTLAFRDLPAGDYTIPLRFTAMNSGDDDAQHLTVTLQVRDHVLGAIIVLVLAAFASFLATRIVSGLRQRAAFLERIGNMRPAWLAGELPALPVVWLRAALHQTEQLSKASLLTGQTGIDDRLAAAERMLTVLDRVRQVRNQINVTILDQAVRRRALWKLDGIIEQVGAGPLGDPDVTRFKAALDPLAQWCDPAQQEKLYWADLLPAIVALCAEVQIADLPEKGRSSGETLLARLQQAIKEEPPGLSAKNAAEGSYARLSILWELHEDAESVDELIALKDWPDAPLEHVYKVVDNFWWDRITQPGTALTLEGPPAGFDPPETHSALTFRVAATDPKLGRCYLLNKKLTYRWTITISRQWPWWASWRPPSQKILEVVSVGPKIAQYSPYPGLIKASVRIHYEDRPEHRDLQENPAHKPLKIVRSSDFRILSNLGAADGLAFALALLVSVVSGVALYALAPSFGSAKDYLALFTWGASLDQGKNFLQSLATYSSSAGKPAA